MMKGSMMKATKSLVVCAILVASLTSVSHAGFVQIDVRRAGPPVGVFDLIMNNLDIAEGRVSIAGFVSAQVLAELIISGVTDADPVMHMTMTVENQSNFTWTGYEFTIAGTGVSFVPGSASSDVFTVVNEPDVMTVIFSEPAAVAPLSSVGFEFDILINSIGDFGFSLTQSPIPEPATLMLLSLGGAFLLSKKK